MVFPENIYANYKRKVKPIEYTVDGNGCWNCTSHGLSEDGYPKIKRNKKTWVMSRYIFSIVYHPVPDDLLVMHKCDNPKCINPQHFILGTVGDNNRDAVKKQRNCIGMKNSSAKFVDDDIIKIRRDSRSIRIIAKEYNVWPTTIRDIKNRQTWQHIP